MNDSERHTALMFCPYDVGSSEKILLSTRVYGGTRWRGWLMHCATSRKVAGLIPEGVIGIFY